jgi:hypothetical protein
LDSAVYLRIYLTGYDGSLFSLCFVWFEML